MIRLWKLLAGGDPTAQRTCANADRELGRLWDALAAEDDPFERGGLLWRAAEACEEQAAAYPAAFGADPIPGEGGRDMAESLRLQAALLFLLAEVELVASGARDRIVSGGPGGVLPAAAVDVARQMTRTTSLDEQMLLLERLFWSVVDVVGDQAAEVVGRLPAPASDGGPQWCGWTRETYLPGSVFGAARALWRAWRRSKAGVR